MNIQIKLWQFQLPKLISLKNQTYPATTLLAHQVASNSKCCYSTTLKPIQPSNPDNNLSSERYHAYLKTKKISKAMEAYLRASQEKEELMRKESAEFELGKRHLANMMGLDPDTMTQEDIDESIKYLLPSGLFSPRARPTMKPPSYYYVEIKPAQFAEDGRPFDDMFYTLMPRFYQHLYNIYEKIEKLDQYADKVLKGLVQHTPDDEDSNQIINFVGTTWPDKDELNKRFLENLKDEQVKQFVAAMEYLVVHPYSYLERDFIMDYRVDVAVSVPSIIEKVTETQTDEQGRIYAEANSRCRSCDAHVKVYPNGTGKFNINGDDLLQFSPVARECILFPFLVLNRYDEFDIVATTDNGGEIGRAGAIRFGISKSLCPFLNEEEIQKLTLAGLLSRDIRRKERNKWNRYGARKKPKWKKR